MSIAFQCSCGRTIKASEGNIGQRVRCPNCAELLLVPPETGVKVGDGQKDADADVVDAELVEDDEEASDEEAFEVLEQDRDLPRVERIKKPRMKRLSRAVPRRKSLDEELYERPPTLFGFEVASSAKAMLSIALVLLFGLLVFCLVCGVAGRLGHVMR